MPREASALSMVERAEEAIAAGELDRAATLLDGARRAEPDLPEVSYVAGILASRRGDPDRAVASFERAAELAPEWITPRVEAASEALFGLDDPDAALAIVGPLASDASLDVEERARALFVAASAEWALERDDAALAAVCALAALELDDPDVRCETGHLFYELGDAERAAAEYRAAVAMDPDAADAWYGLGHALSEVGDRDGATEAWLRTRDLDLASPRPPWRLSEEALESLAERTLRELPEAIRERLRDVPILVEDVPSEALVAEGVDPRLLGLFTGTPLPHKEHLGGAPLAPDAAQLFLRNLEHACGDRAELEAQVRITILHETAHFFGLEDDQLDALGLG